MNKKKDLLFNKHKCSFIIIEGRIETVISVYDLFLHIIIQVLNVRVLFYTHFSHENEKTGNVYHVFIRMLKSYRLLGTFIRFYNK